jgi:hypothetical protein
MPPIIRLLPLEGTRLFVEFDDGTRGEIDLSSRLFGPVFEPLRDPVAFAQVTLDDYGAPSWPSGADLAPDAIYELRGVAMLGGGAQ